MNVFSPLMLCFAFCGIALFLSGEGGMSRSLRMAVSLVAVLAAVMPFLQNGDELYRRLSEGIEAFTADLSQSADAVGKGEGTETGGSWVEEQLRSEAEQGFSEAVCLRFGVPRSALTAAFSYAAEDAASREGQIASVTLYLSGKALLADIPAMREYVENTLQTKCEVIICE